MNFLAHLFLSCDNEELLIGNFIADFIKNRDIKDYPAGIQEGVMLHRKIDTYTDAHPMVLKGVRRLYSHHHKYAPVIIDVFYDFLLSKNWDKYTDVDLETFTQVVYGQLLRNIHLMPVRLQKRLRLMISDDWLRGYSTFEGLEYTFYRMQQRVSKPSYLQEAVESLQKDQEALDEEFNNFFPDLIEFVSNECYC